MSKIGIVRFPGSNCDQDVFRFVQEKKEVPQFLWHLDRFNIKEFKALILPGGFSYGDYLRSGALSARSPVMSSVREFAKKGGPVLGICNGFQILTEAGLLPGALVKNVHGRFIDDWVTLKIERTNPHWARSYLPGSEIRLPVAHGDGRFFTSEEEFHRITDLGLIWMRYINNPNGSLESIAGVMNGQRNVVGLMPHPERAIFDWMGSVDGWCFL